VEFLHTPADLDRWLAAAGIADPSAAADDEDLAAAKTLREAIYRLAYAAMTAHSSRAAPAAAMGAPGWAAPAGGTLAADRAGAGDRAGAADRAGGVAMFDPADRAIVNRAAAVAPPLVRIDDTGALVRSGSVRASLSLVARAAIALVTGPSAAQLHECEGPACTRMFLDNSARGTRRWCHMSRCGNRVKVAKFRARQTA
jgi:predicted RNA-binding Zn ribbon-like protein